MYNLYTWGMFVIFAPQTKMLRRVKLTHWNCTAGKGLVMKIVSGVQRLSRPKCRRVWCNGHLLGMQCLASVIVIIDLIITIVIVIFISIMVIVITIRIIISDGQSTFLFSMCKDLRCGTMLSGPPDSANNHFNIIVKLILFWAPRWRQRLS